MNKTIKKHLKKLDQQNRGIVLITVLLIALLLTFVGVSLVDLVIAQYHRTAKNVFVSNALLVAEAGIDQTIYELNEDNSFTGFATETEFFNNTVQGRGTYQTTITAGTGPNELVISSTGRVYRGGQTTTESERKVKVSVVGTATPGYSVYTGPGGLILRGSATITNSELYVNGFIDMQGSARIGTYSNPLNVWVGNRRCPTGSNPGPTYPQVCSTGQPISFTGNSARIYGTVCATGQTSSQYIEPGNGGVGLVPNCTAPEVGTPSYDRVAHINDVDITSGSTDNLYRCSGSDVKTWPANLRLNGNVTIGASCDLTITGNVYITGNLTLNGSARIRVADSLGTTRPVILVDGTINSGGSVSLIANNQGTGFHFLSWRSNASCNPNCVTVTGTDLYNSQGLNVVDIGGSSSLAGMVFQAMWGKVTMAGSGNVGSVIGQTIDLSGSGTIVFGTSLSSGTTLWSIRSYQYDFD